MGERIRTIKPELRKSESLARLSLLARLAYVYLLTYSDNEGRFRAAPALLRCELFPMDEISTETVMAAVAELEAAGKVRLYVVGGTHYGDIPTWREHQYIQHPSPSLLPAFEAADADAVGTFMKPHEVVMKPHEGLMTDRDRDLDRDRGYGPSPTARARTREAYPQATVETVDNVPDTGAQPSAEDGEPFGPGAEVLSPYASTYLSQCSAAGMMPGNVVDVVHYASEIALIPQADVGVIHQAIRAMVDRGGSPRGLKFDYNRIIVARQPVQAVARAPTPPSRYHVVMARLRDEYNAATDEQAKLEAPR